MKQTLHLAACIRRYSCLTLGLCFFSFAASAQNSSADTVATATKEKSATLTTASQVTVKQEALNKGLLITPTQLLTGAVPGLLVRPESGAPGALNQLRIRQGSSFAGHVQPLVVLNGMPLHQQEMVGVSDPLSFLNPQDIASITVLKDAAATAMYGSRGSNGVILITTQPIDESIPEFNLSLSTTGALATAAGKIPVLSAEEFRQVMREKMGDAFADKLGPTDTDWQDEIHQAAYGSDNQLRLNGALGKVPYQVSLGYLNQNGVLKTSKLRRTSGALNLSPNLLQNHLKLNLNLRSVSTNSYFADPGAIAAAAMFDPTKPVMEGGRFGGYFTYTDNSGNPSTMAPANPLSLLEQPEDKGLSNRNLANLSVDYAFHFLPALHAGLNLGYDKAVNRRSYYAPRQMARYSMQNGVLWKNKQSLENTLMEFYLSHTQRLEALRSSLNLTAGVTSLETEEVNEYGEHIDVDKHQLKSYAMSSNMHRWQGVYGKLNYNFAERLELSATLRRDGSSRFSDDNRYFLSRAIGLAWDMTGVGFTSDFSVLDALTLQASYGVVGNTEWSNAPSAYAGSINSAGFAAELRPSGSRMFNAGLEAQWLKNRLLTAVDFYTSKSEDLILRVPIPGYSNGNGYVLINNGSYKRSGLEWDVRYKLMEKKDVSWTVGINGALEHNEVQDLARAEGSIATGSVAGSIGTVQIHKSGYPAASYYVYKQLYDANGKPLPGLYADLNKDGVVSSYDRYVYKSSTPKVYGGFRSDVRYKRLEASFLLQGQAGNYAYNNVAAVQGNYGYMYSMSNVLRNASSSVLETELPQAQPYSDYFVQDASFLRLEYLQVSYGIGTSYWGKPLLRISGMVQNAFTLSRYKGQEPGIAGGIDGYTYAQPRIMSLGLQLNLH